MATETTKLTFVEGAAASTPAASRAVIYSKADGLMYSKDDAGTETLMSSGGSGAPTTADYITGTIQGGLSAEIVIPGLRGSFDIRVAGASDDEFDTTDTSDPMTGWTTLGTPTTHNINSTVLSHYYVKRDAAAGQNWAGIYKAVPGLPDTVICKLVGIRSDIAGQAAGVFIGEATPGKMEVLLIQATHQPVVNAYTNPTTYGSTPYAGTNLSEPVPIYLKIVAASSTDVSYYLSRDGYIWTTLVLNRNPGFTIGCMGIGVNPGQATYNGEATFDWVRFS